MKRTILNISGLFALLFALNACKVPQAGKVPDLKAPPASYTGENDTANSGAVQWRQFFTDPYLQALVDTALRNNLEVLSTLQEIEIARNEAIGRKALIFPSVAARVGAGVDKAARYTSEGAGNASTEMTPGKKVPEPLGDLLLGFQSTWEIDAWHKLHNAQKAAYTRFLASQEARNFTVTNLVAEIANSYYELLALDNQLAILREAIALQQNELEVVKVQKQAAAATELAVKQFQAQVYNIQAMEFEVKQQIIEVENRINGLLGRYPQPILRDSSLLTAQLPVAIQSGIPSQLLVNRPDIRQAELELRASKLDVQVARAEFYPSFTINAGLGFNAFKPSFLFTAPESIFFSLLGDAAAPIINRNAIKAEFNKANAMQLQAMYNYQRSVLNGYIEVAGGLATIRNLQQFYTLKELQTNEMIQSISVAKDLFRSARANYLEVLIAQRDALESRLELIEARKRQFNAVVNIYKALGGGWR